MQLQSQLERRQFRFLIGLQKIGGALLEADGDLQNLVPQCGYGDHKLSDGGGVGIRRSKGLLELLLDLGCELHYWLYRLPFLLLKLHQGLNLRVRQVQESFQVRPLCIGAWVLGE